MITFDEAWALTADVFRRAAAAGSKPLAVVVLDAGGGLVVAGRQDGCGRARVALATQKAESALALGLPTRTLESFYKGDPHLHGLLREAAGASLLPLAGGVLLRDEVQALRGAIGVSGGELAQEEDFLIEAAAAAGLTPDPAQRRADMQGAATR